jgi:hypothetical protein
MSDAFCPRCGYRSAPQEAAAPPHEATDAAHRLDLEALVMAAEKERVYDESVKVRVSQEDIRKLIARRQGRT